MTVLIANNVSSTLTAPLTAAATSMTVTDGSRFPVLTSGQYFYATIITPSGIFEIVKATTRTGNAMSIVRGQDGTNAQEFPANSRVEMRINAASVREVVSDQNIPLEARVTTAENDIVALEGRMTTVEGDITTVEAGISYLQAFDTTLGTSAGSNSIGFLQAGTGATARTIQNKLRDSISVKDFGAVGDGSADDTTKIQAAINALSSNQTLLFEGNFRITNSLTITNKTRVRLTGKGRIFFDGAPSGAYIFFLVGTIDNLEIDSLTLVGDNNINYTQGAIGCNSGQTISNTRFHDLQISNVNVGISHNANLSGSWTNGWCYNNYLTDIIGTVSGSGYGIQAARAYNLHIYGNTINNASRHSIYVGRGHNLACIIENNAIINHRKDVADGGPRSAIDVGRTSGVIIANNTLRDCYDGMIYVGSDTGTNDDNYDILICGNKFGTPKNATPAIWLGEQLTPTTARMYNIDILDNTFEQDCSLTTGVVINLLNGNGITVKNNRLRAYNVAAALPIFMQLGDSRFISVDADISEITVTDNVCLSDKGSVVGGSRILYISDQLCTGASVYTAKNNSGKDWATEYAFEVSPLTNLNSKLKFTTTITYTWSVLANTNGSGAFSVQGCKPTSSVTVRANSGTMAAPFLAIGGYASTTINTVEMYAVNPSSTLTSTQTNMVHRIFVEDF